MVTATATLPGDPMLLAIVAPPKKKTDQGLRLLNRILRSTGYVNYEVKDQVSLQICQLFTVELSVALSQREVAWPESRRCIV
jgi:hypothetical protein